MKTIRTGLYPAGRLEAGAAILAAADVADVRLVQRRLGAFAQAHRAYEQAHAVVATAETQMQARHLTVAEREAQQDAAVEELASALAGDRHSRRNPFAAFGGAAPSIVKDLHYGEKAKAIHRLASAVQESPKLSPATRRAAAAAEAAARLMEKELLPLDKLQAGLQSARAAREVAGKA